MKKYLLSILVAFIITIINSSIVKANRDLWPPLMDCGQTTATGLCLATAANGQPFGFTMDNNPDNATFTVCKDQPEKCCTEAHKHCESNTDPINVVSGCGQVVRQEGKRFCHINGDLIIVGIHPSPQENIVVCAQNSNMCCSASAENQCELPPSPPEHNNLPPSAKCGIRMPSSSGFLPSCRLADRTIWVNYANCSQIPFTSLYHVCCETRSECRKLQDCLDYPESCGHDSGFRRVSGGNPIPELSQEILDDLNPLKLFGSNTNVVRQLQTPGGVVSRLLDFAFPIAGMILLAMIIWGGFEILAGSATKKSLDSGKQRITSAIIGFFILFCAYWIMQIVSFIFGITIL